MLSASRIGSAFLFILKRVIHNETAIFLANKIIFKLFTFYNAARIIFAW